MSRKVCVITGSRSEYGILSLLMKKIRDDPELTLLTVVCGMHLLEKFGKTIDFIKKDGFTIDGFVDSSSETDDSLLGTTQSISKVISGLSVTFSKLKPDIVIILGDRSEALGAAVAASYMNIPVAHIHGGDNARGGMDELARGAITKLSHIHFPATKKSARRILKMGEAPWRIFVVGSPSIDYLIGAKLPPKKELFAKYCLDPNKKFLLIVQHPVSTEADNAVNQIKQTISALISLKESAVLICPNSDSGGRKMLDTINHFSSQMPFVRIYPSLPYSDFLALMKYSSVMIGNSSSAIIESPHFHLPVVNIGTRQEGRERSKNVIDVDYDQIQILSAIKKALSSDFKQSLLKLKNPYGGGNSSSKIIKVLKSLPLNQNLLSKRMMEE